MKCDVCKAENEQGAAFCRNCGHELNKQVNNKPYTANTTAAAVVLGIVSVILAVLNIPIAPFITAIIGLVLSLKTRSDIDVLGIVLNSVALLIKIFYTIMAGLVILIILLFASMFDSDYNYDTYEPYHGTDTSVIEGTYFCKKSNEKEYESIVTIDYDEIRIEDFDNPKETYLVGSYTSSYDSYDGEYKLDVDVDEEFVDGKKNNKRRDLNVSIVAYPDSIDMTLDYQDFYECERIENGI